MLQLNQVRDRQGQVNLPDHHVDFLIILLTCKLFIDNVIHVNNNVFLIMLFTNDFSINVLIKDRTLL